jgi:c-di-GMP-binding flagellar brake protein YcgR
MGDFYGDERRKYVRVSAELTVRIHCGDSDISYPAVFARDVSTGGLGLEIGGEYPDSYETLSKWKETLEVEIDLPSGHAMRIPGKVVWGQVEGKGEERFFRIGIRFLEIPEAEQLRLADFVKAKADEMRRERGK